MAVVFSNNGKTTLSANVSSSATSISVSDGSVFPSLGSGEIFFCTLDDGTNNEIVKVTAISSNTLTVVRAQESTTARAFSAGDAAGLRLTAGILGLFSQTGVAITDEVEAYLDGGNSTPTFASIVSNGTINIANANSRLTFSGYRALEGDTSGSILTVAEGYTTSLLRSNLNMLTGKSIQMNGTTVIDTSRNLTNIGTITSGGITSTGNATFNSNQFKIQNASPTLILKDTSDDDDHQIQFRDNNDALLFAIQTQNADTGDALTFYSVADEIVHRVGSTNRLTVDSSGVDITGDLDVTGTISTTSFSADSLSTDTLTTDDVIYQTGSTNVATKGTRTATTTATTETAVVNISTGFTSVKFLVQITNTTNAAYHVTEITLLNDGTNQYISEYGTILTGSALATFDADKTATNLRLLATPTTTDTLEFKIMYNAIYS